MKDEREGHFSFILHPSSFIPHFHAMSTIAATCAGWLRRKLAWSNSRQSWKERLGGALLLGLACALAWFHGRLPVLAQAASWAALVLALAVLMRRGWVKLFGPVLLYDMIRTARRS